MMVQLGFRMKKTGKGSSERWLGDFAFLFLVKIRKSREVGVLPFN